MKKVFFALLATSLAVGAYAQDLETQSVVDQFSTGNRSSQANGAAYAAPTYADITGSINYASTYEGGTAGEQPVLDVTVSNTTNDPATIPGVTANTADTSSTSNNKAVYVGDGGGGQNLIFGQADDANYYVRTAVYCEARASLASDGFERTYVVIHVPGTTYNTTSNVDAIGGFGLCFESDTNKVQAVKFNPNNAGDLTGAAAEARDATARTVFGETAAFTASGWHIFEISCRDNNYKFYVDGNKIADVNDLTFSTGFAALCYREVFKTNTNEHQGRFDYLYAGPSPAAPKVNAAKDWTLFE